MMAQADPLPPGRRFRLPHIRRYPSSRLPKLFVPPPDEGVPPVEPSAPSEELPEAGPLPHGFTLTIGLGETRPPAPAQLTRFRDVGTALAACWVPPPGLAWGSITVRVAFTRDGAVYGLPRIPFVDAPTSDAKASLTRSLSAALASCTPLAFSNRLGAAIAGEIFAIRFVHQGADHDRR